MSNGISASETGGPQPGREVSEPESPASVDELLHTLGPEGINAVGIILRGEKALRTIASLDRRFEHALEDADGLTEVRTVFDRLLNQIPEITMPSTVEKNMGEAALNHASEQNRKRRLVGRLFLWRRGGDY